MRFPLAFALLWGAACISAESPAVVQTIAAMDEPFLFSYGTWQDQIELADGVATLRDVTNRGGAGQNLNADWSAHADDTFAIRIVVLPGNESRAVRLMIMTADNHKYHWLMDLPEATEGFVWITPRHGAALSQPEEIEPDDGMAIDLSAIHQWQIIGEWVDDRPMSVQIDQLAILGPTADIRHARQESIEIAEQKRRDEVAKQAEMRTKYSSITKRSPQIARVSLAAPDVIAVEIIAGDFTPSRYERYQPRDGDQRQTNTAEDGSISEVLLRRDGETIGWLIGEDRDHLVTWEHVTGDPLLTFDADKIATWSMEVDGQSVSPTSVERKSKVLHWAAGSNEIATHHILYLRMPGRVPANREMKLVHPNLNTTSRKTEFRFEPTATRSDSVHVNQIGFRPTDPIKRAFVSCWMGSGGNLVQPKTMKYVIVDDLSGEIVHRGSGGLSFPADRLEVMRRSANFNGTDVAMLDFSDFDTPGRYRIAVDGVGCSYPFSIGDDVWTEAFRVQMRGLYHNRSGIELGPPHTDYVKPRDMHPADGYPVTRTSYRLVDDRGEAFDKIAAADTGVAEPHGWGGYHDAGDWNPRRVTHMRVTMATLEIFEQFESRLASFDLNIPGRADLPDILDEALFEFECFHRLQREDGGVGYGMESKGDPLPGETSWHNSFASFVLAPDYHSSWVYASVAARLSRLIKTYDETLAEEILKSGIAAYDFAELDYRRDRDSKATEKYAELWVALDARLLAALELYRSTEIEIYHDAYLSGSVLKDNPVHLFQWGTTNQRDHAFVYARLPGHLGRANLKQNAIAGIEALAQQEMAYAADNAFSVTSVDRNKPQYVGHYSTPDAAELTRAHALTGKSEYLAGAIAATQFQSGCNPNNVVYTTGLGANPLKNVFKLDARATGQNVPEGLTPYGNIDLQDWNQPFVTWPITWYLGDATYPNPYAWPVHEMYYDLGRWPMLEEYTVDAWTPNILVWGYLAMRP